jgi:hypothetical protein
MITVVRVLTAAASSSCMEARVHRSVFLTLLTQHSVGLQTVA